MLPRIPFDVHIEVRCRKCCAVLGIARVSVGTLAVHMVIPGRFEKLRRIAGIATLWVLMGLTCEQFTL
jgi:hypothetical protein